MHHEIILRVATHPIQPFPWLRERSSRRQALRVLPAQRHARMCTPYDTPSILRSGLTRLQWLSRRRPRRVRRRIFRGYAELAARRASARAPRHSRRRTQGGQEGRRHGGHDAPRLLAESSTALERLVREGLVKAAGIPRLWWLWSGVGVALMWFCAAWGARGPLSRSCCASG